MMLALKTLGYGVSAFAFADYFQMSPQLCRQCLIEFCALIKKLYEKDWLRTPTKTDVERIFKLHEAVHGVPGMLGSLDCSQTHWKNCPKAHHGSYVSKEKKPCIVLEAVCDYNLYIWHASYGFCGALNDVNILYLSPLLEHLLSGTFKRKESNVVPFEIAGEEFNKCYLLTDGIYPRFTRFVKAKKHPIDPKEKRFTAWQESARKDIERAFGVLKAKFQFVARPIMVRELDHIAERMACCLILHNMCVSDRVMETMDPIFSTGGNDYDPTEILSTYQRHFAPSQVDVALDRSSVQAVYGNQSAEFESVTGASNFDEAKEWLEKRQQAWAELDDGAENLRLIEALQNHLVANATDPSEFDDDNHSVGNDS